MQWPREDAPPAIEEKPPEVLAAGQSSHAQIAAEAPPEDNPMGALIEASEGSDPEGGEEEKSRAVDRIVTHADVGRRLGDLAYEIDTGEPAALSEDQERMLHELLFDKAWTSKAYPLGQAFSVTFRTFTPEVSKLIAASLKEIASKEEDGEGVTEREFIIYNNVASVAAALCRYGSKFESSPETFENERLFWERVDFVSKLPAQVLDRLSELLNQFNAEVRFLLSGKSLKNS